MDRLKRTLLSCGLLLLTTGGCRNMRHREVPPGPETMIEGKSSPDVAFSTKPHEAPPQSFGGSIGGAPGNRAQGGSGLPMPPSTNPFDTPPAGNSLSGSAGLGRAPSLTDPDTSKAESTLDPLKPVRGQMGTPGAPPSPL